MGFEDNDNISLEGSTIMDSNLIKNKSLARQDDQKEFEDELEYGANIKLSERLDKYRFLNSFATSIWNKYVS